MKIGFFDLESGENPNHARKKTADRQVGCPVCGLNTGCNSPEMGLDGKGAARVLIIAEYPTATDDNEGKLFSGTSGDLLRRSLKEININLEKDCYYLPAVRCFPGENVPKTAKNCRSKLLQDIESIKPQIIIPLGATATEALIGHRILGRLKNVKYNSFFGERIPDQELKCWVCPTYSPKYLKFGERDVLYIEFMKHLKVAFQLPPLAVSRKVEVQIANDVDRAISFLDEIDKTARRVSIDYETTGLKPDREGHEIVCVSFATDKKTYSMPFFKDEEFKIKLRKIFLNKKIGKIAHNITFENSWTKKFLNVYVNRWIWDTCLAAHCIDNRKPVSLKYLTYCQYGVLGYDEVVDKFITGVKAGQDKKNSNHFNRANECDMKDLLYYCGMDSYYSYQLYSHQKFVLNCTPELLNGFRFFLKGQEALSQIHRNGMRINLNEIIEQHDNLTREMVQSDLSIKKSAEFKAFGSPDFNYNSNLQLGKLLYDILKYPPPDGKRKCDEAALKKINRPFTRQLLDLKKLKKIRDVYLEGFKREQIKEIIRPFFNLHNVDTFRSSSDRPNFQNIPKRNEKAKKIIRSTIRPRFNNRIIEYDYKGVEVSISACYHKDPNMIKYILDESTDMHRDTAMDLFFRTKETFSKEERHWAKNGFVFPAFYGSSAYNIAPNIWEMTTEETRKHLKKNGIKSYNSFKRHVEKIEDVFWNERFQVYSQWKKKVYKQYVKDGYIDLYTGFRCWGPMDEKKVCNYPIQGSAFHCLLYTVSQVQPLIDGISGRSRVIGQIHDAIVVDAHKDEEDQIDRLIKHYGTEKVREKWDWIIVPLKIEKERTAVNGSWAEMEDCGYL
jgi:uracil-DNA glycosylase family 4